MDEFFRIYKKVKWHYGLSRKVKKSIYNGFSMRIYSDDKLIIKEEADDEDALYYHALLSLIRYVKSHEPTHIRAHAKSSTKRGKRV